MRFQLGQCYRLNEDPAELYAYGVMQHAGSVVQLESFENLHNGVKGARVRLPGGARSWVALSDLCGDNILWDTYSALLEGLNAVWLTGGCWVGPLDFACQAVAGALQCCHQVPQQEAPVWIGAVMEEVR